MGKGCPWGGWFDLPTPLELWLASLGVFTAFNPPRTPQDNGVTEKSHDTGQRWGDVAGSETADELRANLVVADMIRRERYLAVGRKSRLGAFPELAHPGREYRKDAGGAAWGLAKAEEVLEGYVGRRRVTEKGQVCAYHRRMRVGKQDKGMEALVRFDRRGKTHCRINGTRALPALPTTHVAGGQPEVRRRGPLELHQVPRRPGSSGPSSRS